MKPPTRRTLSAALALAGLAAWGWACAHALRPPAPEPSSRRSLPAGELVGAIGRYGSFAWLGIPYAQPPVGALRWRAPRPAPRWEGVREALVPGAACPQFASVYAGEPRGVSGVIGSEDCLTLDVWAPRGAAPHQARSDARLPVMVWIHGGGHSIGRSGFYDGGNLAARENVVVVAIQYRLGPLGWLRHEVLRAGADSELDRSGNFGSLDTIRALEWVRDNVAGFGGDPGNVTVFGESAGGTNVLALLLAPQARGLFQRAILQSPGMGTASKTRAEAFRDDAPPGHRHSANEALLQLLQNEGRAPDRASARALLAAMAPAAIEAWLRGKRPDELLAAYTEGDQGMLYLPTVFRDGVVLPEAEPMELLARGAYHRVPVLLGTNRDENKLFMAFEPELAKWRLGLFPAPRDADRYQAHSEALANAWKAQAVDGPARAMRAVQGPSVFAYRWDWDEERGFPLLYSGRFMLGASHGLEIPFVFGHWDLGPESWLIFGRASRAGREVLSAQMMSYWAQFARSGAPGRGSRGDLPEWRPWDDSAPAAPRYAVLDTPEDGGVRMASETWSVEQVVEQVLGDPRLAKGHHRCAVLRGLALWEYTSRAQYAAAGGGICAAYAIDAYPWTDVAARHE